MKGLRLFTPFLASLALAGLVLTHPLKADECTDEADDMYQQIYNATGNEDTAWCYWCMTLEVCYGLDTPEAHAICIPLGYCS